jgi:hypothetical protein
MSDNTLIKATGLWAKTSGKSGRRYLTGRLGGLRVLIFENSDAGEGDPTHLLMLGEAEQRPAPSPRHGTDRAGRYDPAPQQRHAQRARAASAGRAIAGEREEGWPPRLPDGGDDVPFAWIGALVVPWALALISGGAV